MKNDTWVIYPIQAEQLRMGENTLEITVTKLNPQMSETPVLSGMEILVAYNRGVSPRNG